MSRPGARTDAELVHAFTSGDRAALGDLYDRFAPGLFDTAAAMLRDRDAASDVVQEVFCVAAAKLDQLRDATRIKPWLYAIARHDIYRRTERRSRTTSLSALGLDGFGDEGGMDPMAPHDPHAEGAGAVSTELASLVRDAAHGLDPSDQLLLELSARQGLVGAELAAAIGVPVGTAHSMLFRMRERMERAVGAVVVTRAGRRRCRDLAAVLVGWDGRFDVLWRKRISRHIDDCDTCQATRRGAGVLSMAGFAPAFALPAMLRERTLAKALGAGTGGGGPDATAGDRIRFDDDGFPTGPGRTSRAAAFGGGEGIAARSLPIALAATLVAGLVIVLGLIALAPTTIDGSVSDDAVSPAAITPVETDQPATTSSTSTTSTTTSTSTSTCTSTTSTTTTTTPLAGPATQPTTPLVTLRPTAPDPTAPVVTPPPSVVFTPPTLVVIPILTTTTASTTPATPTTTTTIPPSPPQVRSFDVSPSTVYSCDDLSPTATASLYDRDGDIVSASVSWSGRGGSGTNALSGSGGQYSGSVGPLPATAGFTYTVTLTVTDAGGRSATASNSVGVAPC